MCLIFDSMEKKEIPKAWIPMDNIIGVTELRYKFKETFESIKTGNPIMIYRGRKRNLVIITEEEYQKFTEYQETLKNK